jgi:signal transduction histidine kinase
MSRTRASRHAPRWWPDGESWPPAGRSRPRRGRFLWRAGLLVAPFLILTFLGATRLLGWLLEQAGVSAGPFWAPRPLALAVRIFLVLAVFLFVMRRVGRPLGDVVGAADRVAEGDFSARVREHGPPWVRSIARAFNSMTTRLERQQRQRRDLMADVAHELRTPLTVMQGRLEGMLDGVYPRDEAHVSRILDETRRLGRLVDDLRTLAYAEGGTLALQREPTDLSLLLEDAAAGFRPEAERRRVTLSVQVADGLPMLNIDPVRIREVVSNLVSNAMRYVADAGAITIDARATTGAEVVVEVSDNGSGIPAADLPHVFDRFYKGRSSSGSGLGLAIAHNLVTAHGGTIVARSTAGRNTTFAFTLPAAIDEGEDQFTTIISNSPRC